MSQLITNSINVEQGLWRVDQGASHVYFVVWDKWGLTKVKGRFENFSGVLYASPDLVDASFRIDASSVNTGNYRRDQDLRSSAFFAVERYPEIGFRASSVVPNGAGIVIAGSLDIRDRCIPLALDLYPQTVQGGLVVRTKTTISREATGLSRNWLGMIRGDADFEVELVLIRDE